MDADYAALTREYLALTSAIELSDQQADRMGQLLDFACRDLTFAVLTNEIDEALFSDIDLDGDRAKAYADDQTAIVKEFVLRETLAPVLNMPTLKGTQQVNACKTSVAQTQTLLDYYQLSRQQHLSNLDINRIAELLQITPADVQLNLLKTDLESSAAIESQRGVSTTSVPNKVDSRNEIRDITFKIQNDRINQLAVQQQASARRAGSFLTYARVLGLLVTTAIFSLIQGFSTPQHVSFSHTPEASDPFEFFPEWSKTKTSKEKIKSEAESATAKTPKQIDKEIFLREKAQDRNAKASHFHFLLTRPYKAKNNLPLSALDLWGNVHMAAQEVAYDPSSIESIRYLQYQKQKQKF